MLQMSDGQPARLRLIASRYSKSSRAEPELKRRRQFGNVALALAQMAEQLESGRPLSQAHIEYYERTLLSVLDASAYAHVGALLNRERVRFPAAGRGWRREPSALHRLIDEAVAAVDADMGNLQIIDPLSASLHIVASRGFATPFLDFFATVDSDGSSVCSAALKQGHRVVVTDVDASPLFRGHKSGEVLRQAGVRAVQSTPITDGAGHLLGMISTHWRSMSAPSEDGQDRLDSVARHAARKIWPMMMARKSS